MPPSPPGGLPVIGHLHLLTATGGMPHHALAELSRRMHAPLLRLRLGTVPAVVISSPALARAALTTHDAALLSRPDLLSGRALSFGSSDVTYAPSTGPTTARRGGCSSPSSSRRAASRPSPPSAPTRSAASSPASATRRRRRPSSTSASASSTSPTTCSAAPPSAAAAVSRTAAAATGSAPWTRKSTSSSAGSADCFPELEPVVSFVTGFRRRLARSGADLRRLCDSAVDEHIANQKNRHGGDESFVDALLRAQSSAGLTADNVKALVRDVFVGGTDATFTTPERVMAELVLRHPRALSKAQDEVRRVVAAGGKGGAAVDESHLGELRYLRAAVKKTLRLHPPVPLLVQRESVAACALGGYDVPAGTRVLVNAFAIGRDPEVWEDPLRFSPERFEDGGGGEVDFRDAEFRMLPFGGGRRGCPGHAFAMATVQLALASLLYHFDWALPDGVSAMDVNLEESFGLTTRKKEPLLVVVRKSQGYEFKGEELHEV
ncbi:unnamed protein product [Urochloa humidicola]